MFRLSSRQDIIFWAELRPDICTNSDMPATRSVAMVIRMMWYCPALSHLAWRSSLIACRIWELGYAIVRETASLLMLVMTSSKTISFSLLYPAYSVKWNRSFTYSAACCVPRQPIVVAKLYAAIKLNKLFAMLYSYTKMLWKVYHQFSKTQLKSYILYKEAILRHANCMNCEQKKKAMKMIMTAL